MAAIVFRQARTLTSARHSRVSRFRFARPILQHSVGSQQALLVPACGELIGFRPQLLRLPNGFRFLRVRPCRNLSSSICAWHIFSHFCHARRSVLHRPTTLTCPGIIAPPNPRDPAWDGTSTIARVPGYSHCSKSSICFLMDATLSSISSASASRLGEAVLSFRAWCSS